MPLFRALTRKLIMKDDLEMRALVTRITLTLSVCRKPYHVFPSGTWPIPASAPITFFQSSLLTTSLGTGPVPKISLISK
ncbi:Uncharacterized protein HZ326_26398 [Fusarium oxysporum f. sp. albedinis]|nr:Uncharacterized protein HZ326_26398 [Fusarium oxysporum f. sp. albedinis]